MSIEPVSLAPPANLAEVLQRILSVEGLARQRRQDLMSAVRQVARLVGGMPADIPADPEALRRGLSIITPVAAGMAPSRFRNVKALLAAALDLTGAKVVRRRRLTGLTPTWRALLARVEDRYERARLSRFFTYASANGTEPGQVNDEIVANFTDSLKRNSLLERQAQIVRDLCLAWNRCTARVAGWPAAQLTVLNRRGDYALPVDTYPGSFSLELEAYLARLASDDLFDETGRGPASPVTLRAFAFAFSRWRPPWFIPGGRPTRFGPSPTWWRRRRSRRRFGFSGRAAPNAEGRDSAGPAKAKARPAKSTISR
jgi:hypothetical protein